MTVARVLGRGQVTLPRQIRRMAGINPGDTVNVEVVGPGRLQFTLLPKVSPRDLRQRYPIDAPIDEPRDREAWQATAVRDVLRHS